MNFDNNKYKIYTWKNWMTLVWGLTPIFFINELIFGQRVPKITLVDKTSNKPRYERTYIPCPHCETLHDARTWSEVNGTALKNWFGLYCNSCGKIIPCVLNIFSFIILVITYPIWGWFKNYMKRNWLKRQPQRFDNIDVEKSTNPFDKKNWLKTGLGWGAFMLIMMTFIVSIFDGSEITIKKILFDLVIWTLAGLAFGYSMKLFYNAKA